MMIMPRIYIAFNSDIGLYRRIVSQRNCVSAAGSTSNCIWKRMPNKKESHIFAWIFFAFIYSVLALSSYTLWYSDALFFRHVAPSSSSSRALRSQMSHNESSSSLRSSINKNASQGLITVKPINSKKVANMDISVWGDVTLKSIQVDIHHPLVKKSPNLVVGYFEDDTYQPYSLELFLSSLRTVAVDATVLLMCPSPVQASVRELAVAKRAIVLEYDAASIQAVDIAIHGGRRVEERGGEGFSDPTTRVMLLLHDLLAGNSSVFHGVNKILITGVNNVVFQLNPFPLTDAFSKVGCFATSVTGWKQPLKAMNPCFPEKWTEYLNIRDFYIGNIFISKTAEMIAMLSMLQNILRGEEPSLLRFPSCQQNLTFTTVFNPLLTLGLLTSVIEIVSPAQVAFVDAFVMPVSIESTNIRLSMPFIRNANGKAPLFFRGYRFSEIALRCYLDNLSDSNRTSARIASKVAQELIAFHKQIRLPSL